MLEGKKILLAVTGSIAAYKAAFITRLLIKQGAFVKIIMTKASSDFVTPLTLGTLSKEPVLIDFLKDESTGEWNNHVDLGIWADLMLIAPATANSIAKMVGGNADNFFVATYLSAKCPVFVAPAMDLDMYAHGSTQDNLKLLQQRGNHIIFPESGELASGLVGEGRLAEPEVIVKHLENFLKSQMSLSGKRILITAGPTHEPIDPVRYIGNRSSGKMGFAIAIEAIKRGAEVTLISGPTSLETPKGLRSFIQINTAKEIFEACQENFEQDAIIMAAAVADYTPKDFSEEKVKKKVDDWAIELSKTQDVLMWMGEHKTSQKLIGFALETNNEIENAKGKLVRKNLDAIVLNTLQDEGAGFQTSTNKITIIGKNNKSIDFELKSKAEVAVDILDYLEPILLTKE
jgi:phosphopantothenoylcysteine decarboxylase / phosphopantothenate---cysteine ligase